jgi:uncharacterized protein (DUF2267 family)
MSDFYALLAGRARVQPEVAQRGMNALLRTLRERLPSDTFEELATAIPGLTGAGGSEERNAGSQLNFWNSLPTDSPSRTMSASQPPLTVLLRELSREGFSLQQSQQFLPTALRLLGSQVPAHILQHIEQSIPGLANIDPSHGKESFLDRLKRLF